MDARPTLRVVSYAGQQPYRPIWDLQRRLWTQRYRGEISDTLLLLEHRPVVTLGRNAHREHLLLDESAFTDRAVEVVEVDRGGDVTYHGPGQLVAYWIFDLRAWRQDVHQYLRQIEEVVIRSLARFEIVGERSDGATGVWTKGKKIAAIGLHLSHWVSTHGFALNVTTDLEPFGWIVPCGLRGREVTSMERHLARAPSRREIEEAVVAEAAELFGRRPEAWSANRLEIELRAIAARSGSTRNISAAASSRPRKGSEAISEC